MHICSFQAHQIRKLIYDDLSLCCALIHTLNAASLPVCPVNVVPQQCESENVRQLVLHQNFSPSSISIHDLWIYTHTNILHIQNNSVTAYQ